MVRYFKPIAFQVPAKVSVFSFANRSSDGAKRHSPAHALFDPLRLEIVVYRASEARPWGQAWSREVVGSFLRHEMVHTVIWEAVGADSKRLRPEWHEFIAYAIQIDLMEPELRQRVLAAHADLGPVVRPFRDQAVLISPHHSQTILGRHLSVDCHEDRT